MATHRLVLILWLVASNSLPADHPQPTPREAALEQLLSERQSAEAFDKAVESARNAGVSEQGILEARFLYHVDRSEDEAIAALTPEFLKRRDLFKIEDSAIFATVDDWLAVTEYAQALAALQRDDINAFKKHITEAFWLSPKQGAAFAPHIDRQRLADAMKNVRIDFTTRLASLHQADAVPLAMLNAGAPATLLHFWSPWSRECEATMPDFISTATELEKHNIAVISILPEQSPEIRVAALDAIAPLGAKPPGAWLLDRHSEPMANLLHIQSLPTMVLLDDGGAVVFNGHPVDEALWKALSKIAPTMTRPAAEPRE